MERRRSRSVNAESLFLGSVGALFLRPGHIARSAPIGSAAQGVPKATGDAGAQRP
jgi:hypothetical protein